MSRVMFSTRISPAVIARFNNTHAGLQRAVDPRYTKGDLIEKALTDWCERMEDLHNGGVAWPPEPGHRPSVEEPQLLTGSREDSGAVEDDG